MNHEAKEITLRLSEGTKTLAREIFLSTIEPKIDRLIELLEAGVHIPDLGFINAKLDLILGLLEDGVQEQIDNLASQLNQDASEIEQALKQPKTEEN